MIGVLLANLGTPTQATTTAVRRYLAEFLADPRIVEISKLIWLPILHGLVLRTRPQKSAKLYQKIWLPEGSPLLIYSQRLAKKLQLKLQQNHGGEVAIELGMRYGQPSIASALEKLKQKNIKKLIILPLYPQYSATTTASTFDAVAKTLKDWRYLPELHFIQQYYSESNYTNAVANSIKQHKPENNVLLFSFHGLPKRNTDLGDPYQQQCLTTAQTIAEKLQLPNDKWMTVFQSRFGRAEWLQPYCDQTLKELPKRGIKNISVVCPGFSVDCLETLEEIAQQNREIFLRAGGESFNYIPALNDNDEQINLLSELIRGLI
jgi:protoporphyrin/coproporphyrin ferrochelatase